MEKSLKYHLSDITLRNILRPGDLGYIAHVHGDLYAKECGYGLNFEAYVLKGLNEFAHEYDPLKDKLWIAEHNDKIVGFLIAQHRGEAVQFRYFIFLPEFRGIGLGKKLMQEFINFMRERGYRKAFLWTTNEQQSAIALYTRFGFVLTEEVPSNTFDKQVTEQRYDLTILN